MSTPDAPWFDAHLDLAFLAETGRDMHAPLASCRGRFAPPAVTLPSLREGSVRACLATIFTEAIDPDDPGAETGPWTYPEGDADAAWRAGMRQLKLYHAWRDAALIELIPRRGTSPPSDTPPTRPADTPPIRVAILMECADPIASPEDARRWAEAGVVAVSLTWRTQGRYAGGDACDTGLTDAGRDLVRALTDLAVVLDVSHLSQRACDELLSLTDAAVIASHCNCRALLGDCANPDWQRHLDDDTIREIARRGGIVGVNLVRNFIRYPLDRKDRPTVAELCDHIEHIRSLTGSTKAVALGSDMDGGITADDLPAEIQKPADLPAICVELARRGWTDEQIADFRWHNWARFWNIEA